MSAGAEIIRHPATLSSDTIKRMHENEDGDAKIFIEIHRHNFVFDHSAQEWCIWRGHYWETDITDIATAAVIEVVERYWEEFGRQSEIYTYAVQEGDKETEKKASKNKTDLITNIKSLQTRKRKSSVLWLASRITRSPLAIVGNEWDRDKMLLGCKNGVVNLKTGKFRPGKHEDFIKTAAPHDWDEKAECPQWKKFLSDVFADPEIPEFIQRLLGYAITGQTTHHIYPIFWGRGRNGKGTLIETIRYVLGDLAHKTKSEMLLDSKYAKQSGAPDSDTLQLMGKRIVWASETNEGRRINAGKLKELVGGDTLNARAPFGRRAITFEPTHTLFLITNEKPHAPSNDYALWERVLLIPFEFSFVNRAPDADFERNADPSLPEKLKSEASGILAWLVEGTKIFLKSGLNPPKIVKNATVEYRSSEDLIGAFLEENCRENPMSETRGKAMYSTYKKWAETSGMRPMSGIGFGKEMAARFDSYRSGGTIYTGIEICTDRTD